MLNITDNKVEQSIPAFFRLGFRPMFLSAAVFSCIAIALWLSQLSGLFEFSPYGGSLWWHGHEMIFGFASAVVVGFLLTAVQNWTGVMGLRGKPLMGLYLLWLLARLTLVNGYFQQHLVWLAMALDLSFLPVAAYFLSKPILKAKQYRNLFFVPVLLVLTLCNLASHLSLHLSSWTLPANYALNAAVMLIVMIMTVMGGRVIPFFTANGTGTPRAEAKPWLEKTALVSTWVVVFSFLFNLTAVEPLKPILIIAAAIAGLANLWRWSRWRFSKTLSVPLLWSLQLAYLFIPVSHILLALHWAFGWFDFYSILHGYTLGAMGNMILAMMARVSLGHSGRPLEIKPVIKFAFASLVFAALVRFIGVNIGEHLLAIQLSGIAWLIGYSIFSWVYWPVLTQPRVDGRPG